MEIWDLYNAKRELTGKTHVRGTPLPEDGYHLVVHVWIRNSKGEYLLSKRAADRPTYPLLWECVGGSVVAGEDSLAGALRETLEEVGISLSPDAGQVLFTKLRGVIDGKIFNDIMDVWLFDYDGEADLAHATTKEVAEVKWCAPAEVASILASEKAVPTLSYFLEYLR